jgi:hypothetical protein
MGRRSRLSFRGLIRCSLALRPACSRDRQAVLYVEGFDGFVTSTAAPTATGWSEPVAGWELHPLKTYTFARRTVSRFLCVELNGDADFRFRHYELRLGFGVLATPISPRISLAKTAVGLVAGPAEERDANNFPIYKAWGTAR